MSRGQTASATNAPSDERLRQAHARQRSTEKRAGDVGQEIVDAAPAQLAQRVLFAPVADLLRHCAANALPDCEELNRWAGQLTASSSIGVRDTVRFVLPDKTPLAYEARVHARREVVTRPRNWHDFFNALVWLRFPQTKAALNAAHLRFMRRGDSTSGRGPVRDALTQFDESGVVVVSSDAALLDLLLARRWKELFSARRAAVVANMRFVVFGHGLYDALRAPFYCICGRAALFGLDRATVGQDVVALCGAIDPLLAARIAADYYPRPRALPALPLLGIPGVVADSESPAYYDDPVQFRPPPAWACRE